MDSRSGPRSGIRGNDGAILRFLIYPAFTRESLSWAMMRAVIMGAGTMWIIFLEAAVALGIAVAIVWWTWPKKSDSSGKSSRDEEKDKR